MHPGFSGGGRIHMLVDEDRAANRRQEPDRKSVHWFLLNEMKRG